MKVYEILKHKVANCIEDVGATEDTIKIIALLLLLFVRLIL